MKSLIPILFILLLALLGLLAYSFFMEGSGQATATVHPLSKQLLKGVGMRGQPGQLALGSAVTFLLLGIMSTALLIGLRKRGGMGGVGPWVLLALAGYAFIFSSLIASYHSYARGGPIQFFGGFPAPTAWMMYGVWLFPWILVGLFIYSFDRWYLTDADRARFEALLKQNEAADEEAR